MPADEEWAEDRQPVQAQDEKSGFVRQASTFRSWVMPDGGAGTTGITGHGTKAGRHHFYTALTRPWASRALIVSKPKRLGIEGGYCSMRALNPVDLTPVCPDLADPDPMGVEVA